uniref:Uncharacterized protein n=1 Tax=Pectinophora gossypiella TaxID=13191 RepID=A0A1E1WVJ8_PECGO
MDEEDTQYCFEKHTAKESMQRVMKKTAMGSSTCSNRASTTNVKPKCLACAKLGEDKRIECFAQLLVEEYKYVTPCMRTRSFVKILNFLNTLKTCHTEEIEVSETEKI